MGGWRKLPHEQLFRHQEENMAGKYYPVDIIVT